MADFYKNLSLNLPKDDALHQAKLTLLEAGKPPANWAAFVSIGNPAVMEGLSGESTWWSWLWGLR